jgi:hypothetical protein
MKSEYGMGNAFINHRAQRKIQGIHDRKSKSPQKMFPFVWG